MALKKTIEKEENQNTLLSKVLKITYSPKDKEPKEVYDLIERYLDYYKEKNLKKEIFLKKYT